MIINLNDDLRIVSGSGDYTLQRRAMRTKKATGETYEAWDSLAFHGRLEHSLRRSLDFMVCGCDEVVTVGQLADRIEAWIVNVGRKVGA